MLKTFHKQCLYFVYANIVFSEYLKDLLTNTNTLNLLGHGFMLHDFETFGAPIHCRPSLEGTGLVHVLERLRLPSPHVTEHSDHPDQLTHPP